MRIKLLYITAAIMALACSCNLEETASEPVRESDVEIEVSLPIGMTKLTSAENEDGIRSFEVYVYNSDGGLEAVGSSESSSVRLTITTGEKTLVAVVNSPHISSANTLDEIRAAVSRLEDNAPGALVMYGEDKKTINEDTALTINVTRLAAKVVISKITNSLALGQYRDTPIILKGIYLVNASGARAYGQEAAPSLWLNKMERTSTDCPEMLYDDCAGTSIAHGTSYTSPHTFYCYPNNTSTDSSSAIWSPRFTRLTVEVSINGDTWYYPISIPSIESNQIYQVNELTITRIGSASPDAPVSLIEAAFQVNVMPWEEGYSTSVTI